ncbi:unnamed protein product [Paramecium octaurelia]|uniref:Uncharacterized protein n=1 Tax=Paramecium octaurelia TaxID=43137 RepID=A0A8S1TR56_PAROT|nr:unnamed protein product [Paramecium octaurelia]
MDRKNHFILVQQIKSKQILLGCWWNYSRYPNFQHAMIQLKIQQNQESMIEIQKEKEFSLSYQTSQINEKFKLINSIKHSRKSNSLIFNSTSSILVVTSNENLILFHFKQGHIKKISQIIGNYFINNCLLFMNLQNQIISSNSNCQIRFQSLYLSNNNKRLQLIKINDDDYQINCMLNNREENLLIIGMDNQINFLEKKNQWRFVQSIEIDGNIRGLTLNESQNMILACGSFNYILVIKKDIKDWKLSKQFHLFVEGARIVFYQDKKFAFQPWCWHTLDIYAIDSKDEISLIQQVQIKNSTFKTCAAYSPLQFIENKSILLSKNQNCLIILKLRKNGEFVNEQTIEFNFPFLYGHLSNDGNYLVIWERHIKKIQIWQYISNDQ